MTSTCLGNYQTYYTPIFVYYQALCNKMSILKISKIQFSSFISFLNPTNML